jgi:hypothetical protein
MVEISARRIASDQKNQNLSGFGLRRRNLFNAHRVRLTAAGKFINEKAREGRVGKGTGPFGLACPFSDRFLPAIGLSPFCGREITK